MFWRLRWQISAREARTIFRISEYLRLPHVHDEGGERTSIVWTHHAATMQGLTMIDFFDFCSEMLCIADQRGYFTRLNSAWQLTLGWSLEELSSSPYIDFVHPDDVAATLREVGLLQSGDHETVHFHNRYRCKDGSYKWLAWRAKLALAQQILATARDVTDQRRAEQNFQAIFEQAPVGIAVSDSRTGKFRQLNPRFASILDRSREELLQLDFQAVTHPEDMRKGIDGQKLLLNGEIRHFRMEKRYLRPDGSVVWADLVVAPLCEEGESPTLNLAIIHDVTEIKRAEEERQCARPSWRPC